MVSFLKLSPSRLFYFKDTILHSNLLVWHIYILWTIHFYISWPSLLFANQIVVLIILIVYSVEEEPALLTGGEQILNTNEEFLITDHNLPTAPKGRVNKLTCTWNKQTRGLQYFCIQQNQKTHNNRAANLKRSRCETTDWDEIL